MKKTVTKFDLNAAFKALNEVEMPKAEKGIRANRIDLKEAFSTKDKTDQLLEDYYDVSSTDDMEAAAEDREGEVAQAKLARIEKIVDLDAKSPEDLLPSYAGKIIIQCPQCMQMFYKNEEDIEKDPEDETICNVNEPCQHCGNISGYTVIGKVAPVEEDEMADFTSEVEGGEDENSELDLDFEDENGGEDELDFEASEEENGEDEDLDLDLDLDFEDEEEEEDEEKNESLNNSKLLKGMKKDVMETENHTKFSTLYEDYLNQDFDDEDENKEENNEEPTAPVTETEEVEELVDAINEAKTGEDDDYFNKDINAAILSLLNKGKAEFWDVSGSKAKKVADVAKTKYNLNVDYSVDDDYVTMKVVEGMEESVNNTENASKNNSENASKNNTINEATELTEVSFKHPFHQIIGKLFDNTQAALRKKGDQYKFANIDTFKNFIKGVKDPKINAIVDAQTAIVDGKASYDSLKDYLVAKLNGTNAPTAADEKAADSQINDQYDTLAMEYDTEKNGYGYLDGNGTEHKTLSDAVNATKDGKIVLKIDDAQIAVMALVKDGKVVKVNNPEVIEKKIAEKTTTDTAAPAATTASRFSDKEKDLIQRLIDKKSGISKVTKKELEKLLGESVNNSELLKSMEKDEMNTKNHSDNLTLNECGEKCEGDDCKEVEENLTEAVMTEDDAPDFPNELANNVEVEVDETPANTEETEEIEVEEALTEENDVEVDENETVDDGIDDLFNSGLMNEPVSDTQAQDDLNTMAQEEEEAKSVDVEEALRAVDEINEESVEECVEESLKAVYENVKSFTMTGCAVKPGNKLVVEGLIVFNSGTVKPTTYEFTKFNKLNESFKFEGTNNMLAENGKFIIEGIVGNRFLTVNKLSYSYSIGGSLVEGSTKK